MAKVAALKQAVLGVNSDPHETKDDTGASIFYC